ncbi:MAG: ABC transporter ATP-binding protein [Spirochaetia bacterium]
MSVFEEQDFTSRLDARLWKRLLSYARPYRAHLAGLAVVMIAVALLDAAYPVMTRIAVDRFVVPGTTKGLGLFASIYFLMVFIQALLVYVLIAIAGRVETGVCYDLRSMGFARLQELSLSWYDRTPAGWIMARITSDSERLGETISWGIVDIVWGGAMMIAIAVFMLFMDWRLALITLSVVPPLIVISLYFQQKILKSHRAVRKTNSKISAAYNEGITGAKTTKTLVREEENLVEFQELAGSMRLHSIRTAVFSSLYLPVVLTLGSVGTGLVLWYGGSGVLAGAISYGVLVAFISYTVQFFDPVRELARVLTEFQSAQAAAERVMSLIETEPEITDRPEVSARYGTVFDPIHDAWPEVRGRIEFHDVTFTYPGGETVLDGFNLTVEPGSTVALVGETGSGKSTIVNLACRFYEPESGSVRIDGVDYRERGLLWHYSHLGYVLQAPHLFSGSVRENIRYGRLDADDSEVEEAAALVGADRFISRLDGGFDAEVGEGGGRLSVGEKQLLSFARALIADPPFFIFDEATSSIDTETEQLIQEAIVAVLKGRTSFVVAHRLSTIRNADRILVIDRGRIIEDGPHDTLVADPGGVYRRLYTKQFAPDAEGSKLPIEPL